MWMLFAAAVASAPQYRLDFEERNRHRVQIRVSLDASEHGSELMMANWTPGSYLIRDHARFVETVRAYGPDGKALPVRKRTKNRWVVEADGPYTVDYTLYARERSVRTNWVDDELAVLNGAATFLVPVGWDGGFEVRVDLPEGWERVVSPLEGENPFRAISYDELVDSPIVAGTPRISRFEVEGVPHLLVDLPADPHWDSKRATRDARQVAAQLQRFWGALPYERYFVFNWLTGGYGGLEHHTSTLLQIDPAATGDEEAYTRWLGLVAHELFHVWNGKALHPRGLGPFDYEREIYTPDLWVVEGFTSYYDDLLLVRAGLIDENAYLERLSSTLDALASTPGRQVQTLAEASHDAWIKHYRPHADSRNSTVSYYTKGAVVAWLLDAHIRRETGDARSLDDALRHLYRVAAGPPGYTPEALRAALSEGAGVPLDAVLHRWVDTVEALDIHPALAHFGLRREAAAGPPAPWLGLIVTEGRVTELRDDGPAAAAGVMLDDELVALDDVAFGKDALRDRFPGEDAVLTVLRRGRLLALPLTLGARPLRVRIVPDEGATRRQLKSRARWLDGP